MHRAYYLPGIGGDPVGLDGDEIFIGDGEGLHRHARTYELSGKSILGLVLNAQEAAITCTGTHEALDRLRRVTDADASAKRPGTILIDGSWSQRCYVVASETSEAYYGHAAVDVTLVMLDGVWSREQSRHFVSGLTEDGLDLPFDFPFDLSFSTGKGSIEVESPSGASPRIVFYGPCVNPYVIIGSNLYGVQATVPSGSQAIIDSTTTQPSAVIRDAYGNEQSIFSKAIRDGGIDGGSYAFALLPAGILDVSWSGAFAFDLAWHEHDSEPPWSR